MTAVEFLMESYSAVFPRVQGRPVLFLLHMRYPLHVWEKPFQGCGLFPVTRVPASTTIALHSRVLHSLHGRMSSGPPQPYFAEILRRGGNPAV